MSAPDPAERQDETVEIDLRSSDSDEPPDRIGPSDPADRA